MTKPSDRAIAHLPPAVVAWFNAEQARRDAVKAYNGRLAFVRAHCEFGTSVDPEYQLMCKAEKEARALISPMYAALVALDAAAPEVLKDLETAAIARGNYGLLDGTRVIGWKLSAETADAMGASGMCLLSEIGDELRRLVKLATWWSTGATGRMESLKASLERLFGDDRPMLRQVWDAVLPLIAPITPPEGDAAEPEGAQVAVFVPSEYTGGLFGPDSEYAKGFNACRAEVLAGNAIPPQPQDAEDAARLDSLLDRSWKLEPFEIPAPGGDDADVGWRVIEFHQTKPYERVVAEVYTDDPRAAIDAARAAGGGGE